MTAERDALKKQIRKLTRYFSRRSARRSGRLPTRAVLGPAALMAASAVAMAQPAQPADTSSGLPVPRFVSLKSDRVNLRSGPGTDYPTGWVFRRAGLPVEIVKEFEGWRQVRDAEGAMGWVLQSLLSGRRTALILPWDVKVGSQPPVVGILDDENPTARVVAKVEAGVIANLIGCNGTWCQVSIDRYTGYIEQRKLWGVYDGETIR